MADSFEGSGVVRCNCEVNGHGWFFQYRIFRAYGVKYSDLGSYIGRFREADLKQLSPSTLHFQGNSLYGSTAT